MELPIIEFPSYIEEMSTDFIHLFQQERQVTHFKRLMTGFVLAEKKTLAHINSLFTFHTNQSNLNRFVTRADWDINQINQVKINMINEIEKDGIVVLDDYIVEKYGTELYGVDWHHDHSKGRRIWGLQIADCVYSGKGIYPLLSTVYLKKKSRWNSTNLFRSKIEIQKNHLTTLIQMNLQFSCVVMDKWYFCKDLVCHIERLGKDWIAQTKLNRRVKSKRRWIPLEQFVNQMINTERFKVIHLGDDMYLMKTCKVKMRGIGYVQLLLSFDENGNSNVYVTNRLDWNELNIATRYLRRWDIEVWHREGKGRYGIEDCQLRSNDGVSKHLTLSTLAATLLEIASLLSPVYATLQKQGWIPEMKHRWILTEVVGQLISSTHKIEDMEVKRIVDGILCPYKSTINHTQNQ